MQTSSGYVLNSITNFTGCHNNMSGNLFLLLPTYLNEKAEMTNDNTPGIEIKYAINCYQHGDGLILGETVTNTIYMKILFLFNIFALKCIN